MLTHRCNISDFVRNTNLTDCDALREMYLNAELVNHLPSIIKTVTSRKIKEIRFILSDPTLEKHYDGLDEWEPIDAEICALVDRIRPTGLEGWKLSLKFVITSLHETGAIGKPAARLLPASSQHKYISISIDRTVSP
jgi:hypothetical protein